MATGADLDEFLGPDAPPPTPPQPAAPEAGGLGDTLRGFVDPNQDAETAPGAQGAPREHVDVPVDVGRKAIANVQPELEGTSASAVGHSLANVMTDDASLQDVSNIAGGAGHVLKGLLRFGGDMAKTVGMLMTPSVMGELASHPIQTAELAGRETVKAVTPAVELTRRVAAGEEPLSAIPKAMLEYAYDNPGEALLDVSMVGKLAAGPLKLAGTVAKASKLVEMGEALSAGAEAVDPITLARKAGVGLIRTASPDTAAGLEATSRIADYKAERSTALQSYHDQFERDVNQNVMAPLNPAERGIFRAYATGRVNLQQGNMLTSTGEWMPLKGNMIRPEALEQARLAYVRHLDELRTRAGFQPWQVAGEAGEDAMHEANDLWQKGVGQQTGEPFDPAHPMVQQYVQDKAMAAWKQQEEVLKAGDVDEMKTALQLAQKKAWQQNVEATKGRLAARAIADATSTLPRPVREMNEALAAMGPQGGVYFPTSGEVFNRDQATAGRVLTKLAETSIYRKNSRALQELGVLENQDPLRAIVQADMQTVQGQSWVRMAHDAIESIADDPASGVSRMERTGPNKWNPALDPDVRAGTHQPFDPAHEFVQSLGEERGARAFARLLETSPGESENVNIHDVMEGIMKGAAHGLPESKLPLYKVPTPVGHAVAALRDGMQPVTNPFLRALDKVQGTWRYYTLNTQANRIVNRFVGHTQLALMSGIVPFTPRGITALTSMGRAALGKAGLGGEAEAKLARVFDLPGIRSGREFAGSVVASGEESAATAGLRTVASKMQNAANSLDTFYRGLGMFYTTTPTMAERAQRMLTRMGTAESLADKIDRLASTDPAAALKSPEYRGYLREVDKMFGDYRRQLPIEREAFRRITPFHKFYTETYKRIVRWGFEHPMVANVMRNVHGAMRASFDDTMRQHGVDPETDVPSNLRDAIPIALHKDPATGVRSVTLLPRRGGVFDHVSGEPAEMLLSTMDPVHKMALEQITGLNLFTRERYRGGISTAADREVGEDGAIHETFHAPSFGEATLRTLWPYQLVKTLVANGRVPNDTASLLQMVADPQRAYELESRTGLPRRHSTYDAAATLSRPARILHPQLDVEEPTAQQRGRQRQIVNTQIAGLLQRWPERRQTIIDAIREAANVR